MAGLVNNYRVGLKSGLTLKWLEQVWVNYGATVWLSLQLALLCVLAVILLGVPCAYALARSRSRLA
ncbi:ABC transporter permease, partial [Alcaligenes pakistanensis]